MKLTKLCLGLALLSLAPSASRADIDGSQPAICAAIEIMECIPDEGCARISAEQAGIPRFLHVDFANNRVSRTRNGEEISSEIERSEWVDERLILQGAEDGLANEPDGIGWSMSIGKAAGDMVLSGSGNGVAFVIFGACTIP